MATETYAAPPPVHTATQSETHPLAPISADEIQNAVSVIKSQWPTDTNFQFKAVTLQEPAKAETVPYLEADFHGGDLPQIDRRAFVAYYIRNTVSSYSLRWLSQTANIAYRTNYTKRSSI